jgi:hypothetical protein
LRREGRIDTVLAVLYTTLLLVFVADTVVGIMLFVHSRRRGSPQMSELDPSRDVKAHQGDQPHDRQDREKDRDR